MTPDLERRASPRVRQADAGRVQVRVKPGIDVVLVDISARGLLLETTRRLLPGSPLNLSCAERGGRTTAFRGRVVRCSVSALLPGEIRYRGAVQLDCDQPCLAWPSLEADAHARGGNDPDPSGERNTRQDEKGAAGPCDSGADSWA